MTQWNKVKLENLNEFYSNLEDVICMGKMLIHPFFFFLKKVIDSYTPWTLGYIGHYLKVQGIYEYFFQFAL